MGVPSLIFIKGTGRITEWRGPLTGYLRYCPHAIRESASRIRTGTTAPQIGTVREFIIIIIIIIIICTIAPSLIVD
jgi:hypothetical protein